MERLFPRALMSCIGDDRSPQPHGLAALVDTRRREAFHSGSHRDGWNNAVLVAKAAMIGPGIP